jgi:hypothetical protein
VAGNLIEEADPEMSDADRYQKDFDVLMQEVKAEAERKENADRDAAWKMMEKSFNEFAKSHDLTGQKREVAKKKMLDFLLE